MNHGSRELAKVTLEKILPALELTPKESELLLYRVVYNMYFDEIGVAMGNKYRGRPYTEGAVRYKFRRLLRKLARIVAENNLK